MSTFLTIQVESEAEFKDRKSRFVAYTFHVSDKKKVEEILSELKSNHPKSRHVCYAYILNNGEYRANDDGEPSGSAGLPILNQIKSVNVVNVLVAVVRYFGGTKLGVSGLINAYKTSAYDALETSGQVAREETLKLLIKFDYALMEAVMSFLKKIDAEIENNIYEEKCTLYFRSKKSQYHEITQYFGDLGISVKEAT